MQSDRQAFILYEEIYYAVELYEAFTTRRPIFTILSLTLYKRKFKKYFNPKIQQVRERLELYKLDSAALWQTKRV